MKKRTAAFYLTDEVIQKIKEAGENSSAVVQEILERHFGMKVTKKTVDDAIAFLASLKEHEDEQG